MNATLSAVWQQVTDLLATGVSVIPVRDHEQDGKPAKTPYYQWKQYQSRIIEPEELWQAMEKYNTSAVATLCGQISGNLEVIDIDVKNWPGIDALYFDAIRTLYPDLFQSLRIHSTPSGGFHILYRTDKPTGTGNLKLATHADSTQAGIETRGEGGYIVSPPSLGYKIYHYNPIPVITIEQRESLINLAKSLNQKHKLPPPLPTYKEESHYDENPFDHYNRSPHAESTLLDFAWTLCSTTNHYLYFTRPGKPDGISASFNRSTRLYYIFTSSTPLEPDRGYHPSTILAELRFGGDKRATYRWLIEHGYGKLKPFIEQRTIARHLTTGEPLPANLSAEAQSRYLQLSTLQADTYPHGLFWEINDRGAFTINRERLYYVAGAIGYRLYQGTLVHLDGYLLSRKSPRDFYDACAAYIGANRAARNSAEAFFQHAGDFTLSRLSLLDDALLQRSTKTIAYKYYSNGYLEITATTIITHSYSDLNGQFLWKEQIMPRPFTLLDAIDPEGLYYTFLSLAVGISTYCWRIIGFCCHEYKDESQAYFPLLLESCTDPRQGGGTGKNLFINLLGHSTTLKTIPGAQAQLNEKIFQAWNGERLLAINDLPRRFDFTFFKELASGAGIVKKLFHDERTIPIADMPKILFTGNYSFDASDGGMTRRIIPLEFSSFFTKAGGVDTYFGKFFPQDWTAADWLQYDNIIVHSIQQFLRHGGKLQPLPLSEDGWIKQFDQSHGLGTRQFIQEHWDNWLQLRFISTENFKKQYDTYCVANNIALKFQLASARMNNALLDWCHRHHTRFVSDHTQREGYDTKRGRLFELLPAPF